MKQYKSPEDLKIEEKQRNDQKKSVEHRIHFLQQVEALFSLQNPSLSRTLNYSKRILAASNALSLPSPTQSGHCPRCSLPLLYNKTRTYKHKIIYHCACGASTKVDIPRRKRGKPRKHTGTAPASTAGSVSGPQKVSVGKGTPTKTEMKKKKGKSALRSFVATGRDNKLKSGGGFSLMDFLK
eukprot:gnl/Dysnectes_brevis/5547_a8022_717.p1 GENE.gnl/Dysnectes_brevis/5547_a8022_717~~gnl/Dysnectes_brevis/5547_a8022_717.p1  ORF type:complete len:182 (+),score=10.26 gnl/Dysnectes_brevis/5547_a8022_717:79-624(+)